MVETLFVLIIVIALICVVVWAIQTYLTVIPMPIRGVLCFLVIIIAIMLLWHQYSGRLGHF